MKAKETSNKRFEIQLPEDWRDAIAAHAKEQGYSSAAEFVALAAHDALPDKIRKTLSERVGWGKAKKSR